MELVDLNIYFTENIFCNFNLINNINGKFQHGELQEKDRRLKGQNICIVIIVPKQSV